MQDRKENVDRLDIGDRFVVVLVFRRDRMEKLRSFLAEILNGGLNEQILREDRGMREREGEDLYVMFEKFVR